MLLELEPNPTVELLDTIDVDRVDLGTVIGKEGSKGTTDNLGAVDDSDNPSVEAVAVRKNSVVDSDIFHDLDQSKWGAGNDALLGLGFVQEADVVVHVVDVLVVQTLDILADIDNVLKVLVLNTQQAHTNQVERWRAISSPWSSLFRIVMARIVGFDLI